MQPTKQKSSGLSSHRWAGILLIVGAGVVWISSRMGWLTVTSEDDKAGQKTVTLLGAQWSAELTVCALIFLIVGIAAVALGHVGQRLLGLAAVVVAVFASISPLDLLISGGDSEHARLLLSSDSAIAEVGKNPVLNPWAVIAGMEVSSGAVIGGLIGILCALLGAVLMVWRPGRRQVKTSRFDRTRLDEEHARDRVNSNPESGRALWDAMDSGIDPTSD